MENKKKSESIKEKLKECQKQKEEYLAGWKRARADFLNYQKDEAKRKEELIKYANEKIILKILLILDNLYISEEKIPQNLKENESVRGLLQIKNQILDFLKSYGVEEIKAKGEEFNPEFHEAVEMVESKEKSHIVLEEIRKGYIMNGKTIRPSKVKISKQSLNKLNKIKNK